MYQSAKSDGTTTVVTRTNEREAQTICTSLPSSCDAGNMDRRKTLLKHITDALQIGGCESQQTATTPVNPKTHRKARPPNGEAREAHKPDDGAS
ncbi:hypothetical protein CsSME_00045544 [Camellia sinensis var. sinensis]